MTLHRRARRLRRRASPLLLLVAVGGSLLLLGALVVALTLPGVKTSLESSRASLVAAQDAVGRGDAEAARRSLSRGRVAAARADGRSHGPAWDVLAYVPVVGRSVREVQAVTSAVAVTTGQVLPALVDLDFGGPRDGRLDVEPLRAAQAPLAAAVEELGQVRRQLREAPSGGVDQVVQARIELDDSLTRLARTLHEAQVASAVVPELVKGDQRFLLAVQNNAEQRATGGLLGAYGVLHVVDGRVSLERIGPNQDLRDPAAAPIDLGADFDARYGRFQAARTWRSANLSPDTPTVGKLLAALWREQTGLAVDGVVFVDPVALSGMLGVTGPVSLAGGTKLTRDNAVQVLLVDAYARFTRERDAERNVFLQAAARSVLQRFLAAPSSTAWARAIAQGVSSGHVQVWSAHPRVQDLLVRSRAGGALASSGPYLHVVTQDVGGSKLGTYLRREVRYEGRSTGEAVDLGDGPVDEEEALVTVVLRNRAPAGLPAYVTLRPDDPTAPVGQAKTWLSVYLGKGATLLAATLDGRPVSVESTTEQGLMVFSAFVTTNRGESSRLVLRVRQPASPGQALLWRQQPLLHEDLLVVRRGGAPLDNYYAP